MQIFCKKFGSSSKVKHTVIMWFNSTPQYIPKRNESLCPRKSSHTNYSQQPIIHNIWITQCPSTKEWINKMWYGYAMEYYAAIEINKVLIHGTTWMELRNNMLNGGSQSQRSIYCINPFIGNVKNRQNQADSK